MQQYIDIILNQIDSYGSFVYILLFFIAAFESFVLTGMVIPGTLLIILIGFIASQGVLNLYFLFVATALGAVAGDILSFYFGRHHGRSIIVKINKIFKTDYVGIGEAFFEKHGDKSVFIGRFAALIRPFIPFVAGLLNMNIRRFMIWNFASAILWAGGYLALGYFFGAALKAIVLWAGRFALLILFALVFGLVSYLVRAKLKKSGQTP